MEFGLFDIAASSGKQKGFDFLSKWVADGGGA